MRDDLKSSIKGTKVSVSFFADKKNLVPTLNRNNLVQTNMGFFFYVKTRYKHRKTLRKVHNDKVLSKRCKKGRRMQPWGVLLRLHVNQQAIC